MVLWSRHQAWSLDIITSCDKASPQIFYWNELIYQNSRIRAFCDIVPCSIVGAYRHSRSAYCPNHQGDDSSHWWWRQYAPLKRRYTLMILDGVGIYRRFRVVLPPSSVRWIIALMIESVRSSETSVYSDTTRRYIPEGFTHHSRLRENMKSHRTQMVNKYNMK
jgi:hypothetical protein